MTNFEKFVNIFGFAPNTGNCLTDNSCCLCPICVDDIGCTTEHREKWWNSEYKKLKDKSNV